MPVNAETECAKLHAAWSQLNDELTALPLVAASEGGRSLSLSASDIEARMTILEKRASQLGCPIGRINEPAVVISRARP